MADWKKIKKEYVSSGLSYRQISEKYGVSESTLRKKGAAEGWGTLRNKAGTRAEQKLVEKIAESDSQIDTSIFNAAMMLMDAYCKSIQAAAEEIVTPGMLKDYGTALKSIQAVLEKPSALDIEEQKARIEKLRKETETEQAADVSIEIKGWDDAWAK